MYTQCSFKLVRAKIKNKAVENFVKIKNLIEALKQSECSLLESVVILITLTP